MKARKYFFFNYLLFVCIICQANHPIVNIQYFSVEDGLDNRYTQAIHKSKEGFLWVVTGYGLNRYDGYEFKHYSRDKIGLDKGFYPSSISEDAAGNLWLFRNKDFQSGSKESNLFIFSPKTEKVTHISQYFEGILPFEPHSIVLPKIIDPQKRVWIATAKGELFFYHQKQFVKVFEHPGALFEYITIDAQDHIFIGWEKEIVSIEISGKINSKTSLDYPIGGLWAGNDGKIWIASIKPGAQQCEVFIHANAFNDGGLKPFHFSKEGKLQFITSASNPIRERTLFLYRDRQGKWYIKDDQKLAIYNSQGEWVSEIEQEEKIPFTINDNLEDGNKLWFTSPTGLYKISVRPNPFQLIHSFPNSLSDCRGIVEDNDGNICFINKYLYQWNPNSQTLRKLSKGTFKLTYGLVLTDSSLIGSLYSPEFIAREKNLYSGKEIDYANQTSSLPMLCFLKSSEPNLFLIGTDKGLIYLDIEHKHALPFERVAHPKDSLLNHSTVYYLHENHHGIWAATNNGVFLLTEQEGIIRHFDHTNHQLPYKHIRHIYEDKEGVFWLASVGGGMIRWQPSLDTQDSIKYRQITTRHGLSNNYIYAIYEDDYNGLWLPSDNGLMWVDKSTLQIKRTYFIEDGLPHNEFNITAHYQSRNGTLYFGGLGGLISFHPQNLKASFIYDAPLVITNFSLFEEESKKMLDKSELLDKAERLVLQPAENIIEFRFALLDYQPKEQHEYAYKLEGLHEEWTPLKENYLRIMQLPYGNYTLRIRGRNHGTNWSTKEAVVRIFHKKPFYLQYWFFGFIFILILVSLFLISKLRERTLKKQNQFLSEKIKERTEELETDKKIIENQAEKLKELDALKSRFFANITHELKTPLTLITAPLTDILAKQQLSEKVRTTITYVQQNTQKLINLVEEILDLSRMEHNQLALVEEKVIFYPFIRKLVATHSAYATYRAIDLQFNYQVNQQLQVFLDVKKFEKIINNLLSNALKFTPNNGRILLQVEELEGQLKLTVSDTGRGIHPKDLPHIFDRFYQSKEPGAAIEGGTGIGLALCKEYARLFEGSLQVESKWQKGSSFTFMFPKKEIFGEAIEVPNVIPKVAKVKPINIKKAHKARILIVEDNKEMADYIQSILEVKYDTLQADNGKTALQQLEKQSVDLIISDVMMPQMDGFQLLKLIKQKENLRLQPFIMLTAKRESTNRLQALKLGVDDYLNKPFLSDELLARVDNLLNNYQSRKAYVEDSNALPSFSFKAVTSADAIWLEILEKTVKDNLKNTQFNVAQLAVLLNNSEGSLRSKIKTHTGLSPSEYIREARLMKAKHLLENQQYKTVAEVVYAIGMKHPANFTKMYKHRFGKLPSAYF